jgi:HSP20 family protein
MNKEETAPAKVPAPAAKPAKPEPVFVEAEKMFERLAQITKETTQRAFEYFQKRGGEWGREFDDWFRAEAEILRPVPVEITDKGNMLYVNASVAGFKPDEIEISVKDNLLTISGTTEKREQKKEENVVYTDFASNRFFRQLTLPTIVEADKVEAKLEDGLLRINLPKMAAQEARHISVAAG